ncbi:hypothetical protein AWZ03_009649 [Drosophila navojoa]|uniref:Nucleoporin Nup133/Nup155-like N-terminal domain-containing protein n=1 Tax=Drosophila navojoa TaxID=7232 RepID=A0A484B6N7_DRONA|nr:hypothetical protein AWZ03_009649 [Drosophila navojoa]
MNLLQPDEKFANAHNDRFSTVKSNALFLSPLRLHFQDCLAVQRNQLSALEIYCAANDSIDGTIVRQATIPTGQVKQLIDPTADSNAYVLALLVANSVEFWQWTSGGNYMLQQRLSLMQAEQMALATHENRSFLAVLTAAPAVAIYIYRRVAFKFIKDSNALDYQLAQIFDLEESGPPRQLLLMHLQKSKDLLLCLSNASPTQTLRIYQHQGVAGFQQLLGESTLPAANSLQRLELADKQILALSNSEGIYLVGPQFIRL